VNSPAARRTVATDPTPTGSHERDLELVRGTLSGRPDAVAAFVERMRCVAGILAAQNARLGAPLQAEELADLVQDTLTVVWRKLEGYGGRAALETWVYRFCYLELMNAVRRKRRQPRPTEDGLEVISPDTPASEAPSKLDYEPLYRGLERLGPPESDIIRLKHFEQLTFEELGQQLGISPNTAKTQYYRGMSKLRELLAPMERRGDES